MNHETTAAHPRYANGAGAKPATRMPPRAGLDLNPRALLRRLEHEIQDHPVRTLGIAAGIGVGVGALVVTTMGRRILVAGGSYIGNELLRGLAKALLAPEA